MSKTKIVVIVLVSVLSIVLGWFVFRSKDVESSSETPASVVAKEQPESMLSVEQVPMPVDKAAE